MEKCPQCGYDEKNTVKHQPISHKMAEYVDPKTGVSLGVLNTYDEKITAKGKEYVRKDLYKSAPVKQPEPVKPTEPVKPVIVGDPLKQGLGNPASGQIQPPTP